MKIKQDSVNPLDIVEQSFILDIYQEGDTAKPDWIRLDRTGAKRLRKALEKWLKRTEPS